MKLDIHFIAPEIMPVAWNGWVVWPPRAIVCRRLPVSNSEMRWWSKRTTARRWMLMRKLFGPDLIHPLQKWHSLIRRNWPFSWAITAASDCWINMWNCSQTTPMQKKPPNSKRGCWLIRIVIAKRFRCWMVWGSWMRKPKKCIKK